MSPKAINKDRGRKRQTELHCKQLTSSSGLYTPLITRANKQENETYSQTRAIYNYPSINPTRAIISNKKDHFAFRDRLHQDFRFRDHYAFSNFPDISPKIRYFSILQRPFGGGGIPDPKYSVAIVQKTFKIWSIILRLPRRRKSKFLT